MKIYTKDIDGFRAWDDGSEALAALQALPADRRPAFFEADNHEVVQWLGSEARANATRRTIDFANSVRTRIAKSQHYLQSARWPVQLASATRILAGESNPMDDASFEREARLRELGETNVDLAQKVMQNSIVFTQVGAAIDGIEHAALRKINAHDGQTFDQFVNAAVVLAKDELNDIFTPVLGAEAADAFVNSLF